MQLNSLKEAVEGRLVAIPLFNEEATIASIVREIRRYYNDDILVVNDGSTDCSKHLLDKLGDARVSLISHEVNLGYGQSLIDAFRYAIEKEYTALVTIDCDWQHEPKQIPEFFREIKNYDVVSGSRYYFDLKNNGIAPNDRYKINREITEKLAAVTRYKLTDSFCGFKAYKVSSLKRLELDETGYAMPLQLWIQACAAGFKIKEIPVKRIYNNLNRSFGEIMDDPVKRLQYYLDVIEKELRKNESKCNANCFAS